MKGQGRNLHSKHDGSVKAEYSTLTKDGKPVWEPGLPAEVTARRIHKPVRKEQTEEAPISCDLRVTLKLPPGSRAEWLEKAMKAIPSGRAKVQDVFNIVTHPKFVQGVPDRIGRRMLQTVAKSLDAFSDKQRTTLVAKCKLAELFQASSGLLAEGDYEDDVADEEEDLGAEGFAAPPAPSREKVADALAEEEERPERQKSTRGRSRSRSRGSHSQQGLRPPRKRSRSRRRGSGDYRSHRSSTPDRSTRGPGAASVPLTQPPEFVMEERGPTSGSGLSLRALNAIDPEMSADERASLERVLFERQRQQDEERRKLEQDRRAYEEREKQRKAKLSSAFLVGNEDDDDEDGIRSYGPGHARKGREEAAYSELQPTSRSNPSQPSSQSGTGQDPRFVEAMGGDKLLAEAHKILQSAAGSGRLGAPPVRVPSRSRSRPRRRSRSRSRTRNIDMRSTGSYRSPTPDGRARGQARAMRKAKMIASLMGLNQQR